MVENPVKKLSIDVLCPRNPFLEFAGIENVVIHAVDALKNNYSVQLIASGEKTSSFIKNGVKVNTFQRDGILSNAYFSSAVFSALKKSTADVIHCHGFNNLVTLAGLINCKSNQKFIVNLCSSGSSSIFREILWLPLILAFNFYAWKITRVICLSEFERKRFRKLLFLVPKEKFELIRVGVDVLGFEKINVPKKNNLILSAGRLVKNKGNAQLICAFKSAKNKLPGLKLEIIGDGPQKEELINLAKRLNVEVKFTSAINQTERKKLFSKLKEAGLFALLSDYESQGIVVSEAIAARTPCIVTNSSALAEFVKLNGAVGVDNKNISQISEKIIQIVSNPKKFIPVKIGVLTWEESNTKLINMYNSIFKKING